MRGDFEIEKRILIFKETKVHVDKFPYKKSVVKEVGTFFDENKKGAYFYKAKVSLKAKNGELVDRWFNVGPRRRLNSKKKSDDFMDDLTQTLQETSKGYLSDSYSGYYLEQIEMEYVNEKKSKSSKKARKKG